MDKSNFVGWYKVKPLSADPSRVYRLEHEDGELIAYSSFSNPHGIRLDDDDLFDGNLERWPTVGDRVFDDEGTEGIVEHIDDAHCEMAVRQGSSLVNCGVLSCYPPQWMRV